MTFPNDLDFSAGVKGLSLVVTPMVADPVWVVPGIPDMVQLAMMPMISPFQVKRDKKTGPDGEVEFQFETYWAKMVHWERRTPREPWRGGHGGKIKMAIKNVQATEEIFADQIWPFAMANVAPLQKTEMKLTAQRVVGAFNDARLRDQPDFILSPLINNELIAWDGLPLIDTNHTHPDGGLFCNELQATVIVANAPTSLAPPPARVTPDEPTVEELYDELIYGLTHNSTIRLHQTRFQMLQRVFSVVVIVKDLNTTKAFQKLNEIRRAKFASVDASELEENPFFGNIDIIYDSNLLPMAGTEFQYFVIPKIEEFDRAPGEIPVNPLGLPIWRPLPRPLSFSVIRKAVKTDMKYDEWEDPVSAMIGIWEMWAFGAGFPEEIYRWDPIAPP